jgi:methyltransferase (TIGR00027 family)
VNLVPQLHTTDRPSSTAQWTALGRALELDRAERIVTDEYAPVFLDRRHRALRRAFGAVGPVYRQLERAELAGLAASGLCRHRFVDEHLLAALAEVEQVVLLGAGYDARAWRFAREIADRPVYEVDLAPLSRRKAKIVTAHPELFGHAAIRRVEIDFQRQSLTDRLVAAGFAAGAPAFVAWEGVSMYLSAEAIAGTLDALAEVCGAGSVLAMDLWQQVPGVGGYHLRVAVQRSMRLIGEPITYAVPAGDAAAVLGPHGFAAFDLAESDAMTARYATGGRRCDPGMYVLAARLAG